VRLGAVVVIVVRGVRVVVVVGCADVVEWGFDDLQRYPYHHQHPCHHLQEIVSG
jgi:hypothetical protein